MCFAAGHDQHQIPQRRQCTHVGCNFEQNFVIKQAIQKYLLISICVFIIASLFFFIELTNPSLTNQYFTLAFIGMYFVLLTFIIGLILIILRFLKKTMQNSSIYYATGLLNFCFAISGIILIITQKFTLVSFDTIILPLFVGLYIFIDLSTFTKKEVL